jgi:5-(carboxyamino)imidazole ribonucleotide synthase
MPTDPQLSGDVRVGVIGAGQLARMMGEASHGVGVHVTVLATSMEEPAVATCDDVILGDPKDLGALDRLAGCVDVVTFDHELVDLAQVEALEARGVKFRPSASALRFAVDKAHQRRGLLAAGLPVPRFVVVRSSRDPDLAAFLETLADQPVVKAAQGGYDGRGVVFPANRDETLAAVDELGATGDVLVEERLTLQSEVAQLVARALDGSVAIYPLVTTVQRDAMCVEVRYPAQTLQAHVERAEEISEQIASLIDAVGILAIEFFVTTGGLVVNEVALRPHNSGHWTIEGATTSQFANHLRAVSGQALGAVSPVAPCAVMVNIVGAERPSSPQAASAVPGVFVHDYGKAWRPGRKLGHVTALGDDAAATHVTAWKGALAYGTRTREAQ